MKALTPAAFQLVAPENWSDYVCHVVRVEEQMWTNDWLTDIAIDSFVIETDVNSSTDNSDDEDMGSRVVNQPQPYQWDDQAWCDETKLLVGETCEEGKLRCSLGQAREICHLDTPHGRGSFIVEVYMTLPEQTNQDLLVDRAVK